MTAVTQMNMVQDGVLLAYAVNTSPSPLQVTPPSGGPTRSSVTIVVNNPTGATMPTPVYLQKIVLSLPVSADSSGLVQPGTTFRAMVAPSSDWQVSDPAADGTLTVTPKSSTVTPITGDGLSILLYDIAVNQMVGTASMNMAEFASTEAKGPFKPHAVSVSLAKFPYTFVAGGFTADAVQVVNGGQTFLRWSGSENATYTLLWDSHSEDVSSKRSWQTPRLTNTTTFYLKVTATQAGETVTQYFSLSVAVANPSLMAETLQVLAGTTLNGELEAKAASQFAGRMAVNGELQAVGGIALTGAARLFGGLQSISAGSYKAYTDGFVLAAIQTGGEPKERCAGFVIIQTGQLFFWGTGGKVLGYAADGTPYYYNNCNQFMAPVQKGNTVNLTGIANGGSTVRPDFHFWWVPIGQASGGKSLVQVSERPEFTANLQSEIDRLMGER